MGEITIRQPQEPNLLPRLLFYACPLVLFFWSLQSNSKVPCCPESAIARTYETFDVSANASVCCGACACCSLISCGRHAKAFACQRAQVAGRQVGGIYGGASRCYEESIGEKYLVGLGEWRGASATDSQNKAPTTAFAGLRMVVISTSSAPVWVTSRRSLGWR